MIVWITGNTGSGKTTIGTKIRDKIGGILLDGDTMRRVISEGNDFSEVGREAHNLRVARLAQEICNQGYNVIVTVIAPFCSTRKKIDKMICPYWIYLYRPSMVYNDDTPYESPNNYWCIFNTDVCSIEFCVRDILKRFE